MIGSALIGVGVEDWVIQKAKNFNPIEGFSRSHELTSMTTNADSSSDVSVKNVRDLAGSLTYMLNQIQRD